MFSNIVYKYFEVKKVLNLILDQDWIDNLEPNSSNILTKPLKLFLRKCSYIMDDKEKLINKFGFFDKVWNIYSGKSGPPYFSFNFLCQRIWIIIWIRISDVSFAMKFILWKITTIKK